MPRVRKPTSLLVLCHKQVAANVIELCSLLNTVATSASNAVALTLARQKLRPIFIQQLPGSIRSQLIEEAYHLAMSTKQGGNIIGNGPSPLYLIPLLLANDVHRLRVELCCYYGCSHQAAFLKQLATDGQGLETLEIARSSLLRLDRTLFQDALLHAPALRHLTLRNIASDTILQVIGCACPKLASLDVSNSRQVTDVGLKNLLLRVELRNKFSSPEHVTTVSSLDNSPGVPKQSRHKWPKLQTLFSIIPWLKSKNKNKDQTFFLEYFEQGSQLCETLQVLNLSNTNVSGGGILMALHHVRDLQSLADYSYMGRAFEILDRALTAKSGEECLNAPAFKLTAIKTQQTSERCMELIALACPKLEELSIQEPHHPPMALRYFPQSLTKLHLRCLPSDTKWISELYDYLSLPQGRILKDLSLDFMHVEFISLLDLSQIVRSCPNLRTFSQDGADVDWHVDRQETASHYIPPMPYLRRVQVGRNVTAKAVTELLQRAPVLEVAHFYSCPDMNDDHLINLTTKSCSSQYRIGEQLYNRTVIPTLFQYLECFYIYNAPRITATAITSFLASCENLERIGNLNNFGVDCDGSHFVHSLVHENNLKLQVTTGSHWFCSECFANE